MSSDWKLEPMPETTDTEGTPKFMMKLQEGTIVNANETYEDDVIIYTPINALKFNWSLYEKTMPDAVRKIKEDYDEEKDRYNIIGLVVYKKDGGWCWSGTELLSEEDQRDALNGGGCDRVWDKDRYPNQDYECSPCMADPEE